MNKEAILQKIVELFQTLPDNDEAAEEKGEQMGEGAPVEIEIGSDKDDMKAL